MGHGKTAVKIKRPFGWTAIFFIKKLLREPTYHPQSPRCGPQEGARGAAWGGRGASTTMRVETRTHQSRAAHPPDKACGALAGEEVRGAEEAVARGRRERRKKNTNRYLHNQWQVGNLYA